MQLIMALLIVIAAVLTCLLSVWAREENGSERPHQYERSLAAWTAVLGMATVALVFATIYNAIILASTDEKIKEQAHISAEQLGVMLREERPWIYADISPGGAIFENQSGGFTFPVDFALHNTGKLPAFLVWPDLDGFLSGEDSRPAGPQVKSRQRARCGPDHDPIDRRPSELPKPKLLPTPSQRANGTTVFPGQTVHLNVSFSIPKDRVEAARARLQHQFMIPWGYGCIRYHSPDNEGHQTGFAFFFTTTQVPNVVATFIVPSPFALPEDFTHIGPDRKITIAPWDNNGTRYAY